MPGKFKRFAAALGDTAVAYSEYNRKVDDMTNELMRRTYGLDVTTVRQIAKTLVNQAEVTWK